MRRIDDDERRARLGARHLLAAPGADVVEATNALVALHSSDPVTVYLSLQARLPGFEVGHLETALYETRSLVRVHGMRRTLWVTDRALVPAVHHSSTARLGRQERPRTVRVLEEGDVTDDGGAYLDEMIPRVLATLDHSEKFTRDLTAAMPEMRKRIDFHNKAGKPMGTTGAGSRVMNQLSLESRVVRTRPAGTWVSGQYAWTTMESWLGEPIEPMTSEEASARIVAAYLRAFGPATEKDLQWWTGWPLRQLRPAISVNGAVEVEVESGPALVLPDDVEPVDHPDPWAAALPSLDPTIMGWKERDWYIGDHSGLLFDRNGNAGASIWADGRAIGGWAQGRDGSIGYELLEDVGAETVDRIETRLGNLEKWLEGTLVTARFRSPIDKRLAD